MGEDLIGLVAVIMVFSVPIAAILTTHYRKVLELKLRLKGQGSESVRAEVEALRQEVRALRDTTMQYDLSFDAALDRMESRVGSIERMAATGATGNATKSVASSVDNTQSFAQNSYAPMATSASTYNEEPLTLRAGN